MNFFKILFGKSNRRIPDIAQHVVVSESIVLRTIKKLFPDIETQEEAFKLLRKRNESTKFELALLFYAKGDIEKLRFAIQQSHPHFWMDEISPIFSTVKEAEEWANSISK